FSTEEQTQRETFEMELQAAKMIGAGLACSGAIGSGVGIGNIFGSYLSGAMRNPSAAPGQFTNLLIGFALAEATGLFGLLIAIITLYGGDWAQPIIRRRLCLPA